IRDELSQVDPAEFTTAPISDVLAGFAYPEATGDLLIRDLTPEQQKFVLVENFSAGDLLDTISDNIIQPRIITSWKFLDSLMKSEEIEAIALNEYPEAEL